MGNELSPHSARLFKFLHSWIVKVWRVRQYLESRCQGHIKVPEANSCDGQICGLSSRSSIGRPLAHIMSSEMMGDCGWLGIGQQQTRNAECSNGRGSHARGEDQGHICLIQGVPKKSALSECCWSHNALAQSPFAGTPCVRKMIFWSFHTKTKQGQTPPSHVNGKN